MIITKRAIPRRTVLRGVGATVALPLLDSMVPALTAASSTAATSTQRLGVIYVPNGIVMDQWTPATTGASFELTPILRPLARFRDQLLVISGLSNKGHDNIHETGATSFLTGMPPKRTQGSELRAGVSIRTAYPTRVTGTRPGIRKRRWHLRWWLHLRLHQYHQLA